MQVKRFTLHIEGIDATHYWGYVTEMQSLSRVAGETIQEVSFQLMTQLAYWVAEIPGYWHIKISTEIILY